MPALIPLIDLKQHLKQKGWQPSRKQAAELLAALAKTDRDDAETIELALRRLKGELPALVLPLLAAAAPPQRARLVNLLDEHLQRPEAREQLTALLADADPRTERVAIGIAGRLDVSLQPALLARWQSAPPPETLRALAYALGQIGDDTAVPLLTTARNADDPELVRIAGEALLKLERRLTRSGDLGSIFAAGVVGTSLEVVYRCRRGLEPWVAEESGGEVIGPERVGLRSNRSLADLLGNVRTALDVVIPLPTGDATQPIDEALFAALTLPSTRALLRRLTHGPIRFRIEWAEAGKRRAQTMKLAARLRDAAPELLNDPTASLWQVDVNEKPTRRIELVPKALPDPRFAYRQADVVGSSHPTIAAALAWVAEPHPRDVVWDPFVGGGTELIEIARRQMVKQLYGSDVSEQALLRARLNVDAAGVPAELVRADATAFVPPLAPTLIVSNPPMGRRVLDKERVTELMARFLVHASKVLAPGGRLVWLTPRADDARAAAPSLGLTIELTRKVDLGGFSAELQRFRKR